MSTAHFTIPYTPQQKGTADLTLLPTILAQEVAANKRKREPLLPAEEVAPVVRRRC